MRIHPLAIAAAACIALAPPSIASDNAPIAHRNDRASEKLGMRLSLQCWTFRELSFFETVDEAARMGIRYLEMFPGQKVRPDGPETISKDMDEATIAEVKKKLADAGGLKLVAYGVDGVATDEPGARKEFEWAKKMGIKVLVTETMPNEIHDKLCKQYNIRYALHNHPQSWPPDDVLKYTKDRVKQIGSCSDTGHWARRNLVPTEQFKKLEGRVEHSHFKDLDKFGDGHDVPWGTGVCDVPGMLAELKRQHYKGYLSIEYEYGSVKDLETTVPQCVAFFDKTMNSLAAK